MWRMMRILVKSEALWCNQDLRLEITKKFDAQYDNSSDFPSIVETEVTKKIRKNWTLWFPRERPINAYVYEYYKELRAEEGVGFKNIHDRETQKALQEAQAILFACTKCGFIKVDTERQGRICLMPKGKSFADPFYIGLVNEWLKELGFLRSILLSNGALLVVILTYTLGWGVKLLTLLRDLFIL